METQGPSETELQEIHELEQKRIERLEEASIEAEQERRLYVYPQDTLPSMSSESDLGELENDFNFNQLLLSRTEESMETGRFVDVADVLGDDIETT